MMNPTSPDDDWNDLARELGVDKSKSSPSHESPPADMVERLIEAEAIEPHHGMDERVEEDALAEGEPELAADEEFTDSEDGAADGGVATESEQPGTGRKRRRRRRRRRKGGAAPAEGAVAGATETAEGDEDEAPAVTEEPVIEGDDYESPEIESDEADEELMPRSPVEEEDTANEVLRDLIATWNVPSWDDIVGGLYRPN